MVTYEELYQYKNEETISTGYGIYHAYDMLEGMSHSISNYGICPSDTLSLCCDKWYSIIYTIGTRPINHIISQLKQTVSLGLQVFSLLAYILSLLQQIVSHYRTHNENTIKYIMRSKITSSRQDYSLSF